MHSARSVRGRCLRRRGRPRRHRLQRAGPGDIRAPRVRQRRRPATRILSAVQAGRPRAAVQRHRTWGVVRKGTGEGDASGRRTAGTDVSTSPAVDACARVGGTLRRPRGGRGGVVARHQGGTEGARRAAATRALRGKDRGGAAPSRNGKKGGRNLTDGARCCFRSGGRADGRGALREETDAEERRTSQRLHGCRFCQRSVLLPSPYRHETRRRRRGRLLQRYRRCRKIRKGRLYPIPGSRREHRLAHRQHTTRHIGIPYDTLPVGGKLRGHTGAPRTREIYRGRGRPNRREGNGRTDSREWL
mmetsp:Transcript_44006/g.86311  ORF Transcript_44006/g.86311 Transcript_44006/m.86311 type:complete len:302 (-) Transcript_44006:495-1400(-)